MKNHGHISSATQLPAAARPSSDGGCRAMSPANHYSLFIVHYSLPPRFAPCAITSRAFSPRKCADDKTTRVTQSVHCSLFIVHYSLNGVDPNGEDYEVVVDEVNRTITIRANFYVIEKEKCLLDAGLDMWNEQSGKYTYNVGEGEDAKSYTINFELNSIVCNSPDEVNAKAQNDECGNSYAIVDEIRINDQEVRGSHCNGEIKISSSNFDIMFSNMIRTSAHESGHAMGIGDMGDGGLMDSGGVGFEIRANMIASTLYYAGFNCSGPEEIVLGTSGCKANVKGKMPIGIGVVNSKK